MGAELSAAHGSNFLAQSDTGDGAIVRLDFPTCRLPLHLYKTDIHSRRVQRLISSLLPQKIHQTPCWISRPVDHESSRRKEAQISGRHTREFRVWLFPLLIVEQLIKQMHFMCALNVKNLMQYNSIISLMVSEEPY